MNELVPATHVNFTGRSDLLRRLHEEITQSTVTALRPGVLHGMGGVGKSQTAVEYIYRHVTRYDIVWWIPSENVSQINAALVELAVQLRLPVERSIDTAVPAALHFLRVGAPQLRWLLVFDNADEPEYVRKFWPRGGNGHIIVTSRNSQWAAVARSITVDVFERSESCQLLQLRSPDIRYEEADRLAAALGDLPLAIEQAASWHAESGMTVNEYLDVLASKRTRLLELRMPADYDSSVDATWNVSLDRLSTENLGALELLELCSVLSPEPIARSIFRDVRERAPASPALQEILTDPIALGRAVRDINRYSLAKIDNHNNTLQLHRLVQLVLRNRISPDEQERFQHIGHLLLALRDPGEPHSVESWAQHAACCRISEPARQSPVPIRRYVA